MKVKELLKEIDYRLLQGDLDKEVESIAYDSRQVKEKGFLFVSRVMFLMDINLFLMPLRKGQEVFWSVRKLKIFHQILRSFR